MTRRNLWSLALLVAVLGVAAPARAGLLSDPESAGFTPRVPLSAFARPASWFDPSRLQLTSTVSVGSGSPSCSSRRRIRARMTSETLRYAGA